MTTQTILDEASKLGLEHGHARFTGNPHWRHRDIAEPLICADDFAEAARHFAGELKQCGELETANKLLKLAERYEHENL
jgi:hypothetical protein